MIRPYWSSMFRPASEMNVGLVAYKSIWGKFDWVFGRHHISRGGGGVAARDMGKSVGGSVPFVFLGSLAGVAAMC
jgi:hypothetical protein